METKSRSSGWWRVVEPGLAIVAAVFFAACGEEKGPQPGSHWTAKYDAFGGNYAADHTELKWKEFLDRPVLAKIEIAAPSVMTALSELNAQVRKAGANFDLVVVQVEPRHEGYRAAINLDFENPTVAEVIDGIAREAGDLVWDFQEENLVIRPRD